MSKSKPIESEQGAQQQETERQETEQQETQQQGVSQRGSATLRQVDVFELIRVKRVLEAETPLAEFERLLEGLPEQQPGAQVRWRVEGGRGRQDEALIHLQVAATVTLRCERCLGPLPWPIESAVSLQVVDSEAELDDPDTFDWSDLEQDGFDKVLGSNRFDVVEQVQDELILSVPYVPKHEVCPASPVVDVLENPSAAPSPFAALASIKKDEKS